VLRCFALDYRRLDVGSLTRQSSARPRSWFVSNRRGVAPYHRITNSLAAFLSVQSIAGFNSDSFIGKFAILNDLAKPCRIIALLEMVHQVRSSTPSAIWTNNIKFCARKLSWLSGPRK
jgi:hypothetical protein